MDETVLEISESLKQHQTAAKDIKTIQGENGKRFYVTPKGTYLSVTSFLSHFKPQKLIEWNSKPENQELKKAILSSGTDMHTHIENFLVEGKLPIGDPNTDRGFRLFQQMLPELSRKITHPLCEVPLWSDYLQLAGRADCIGYYDGILSIIDFKTSSKLKRIEWILDYFLQASCYSIMVEEITGYPVQQLVIMISTDQGLQVVRRPISDYLKILNQRLEAFRKDTGLLL